MTQYQSAGTSRYEPMPQRSGPVVSDSFAVDENGICASPNDVPGFDKEKFMAGRP
jgi:hypothetical protein